LLHLSHPRLHPAGEVRHHADHPLHQHELAAVMHLVLLRAQQHLEARFGWGAGHHGHALTQKIVGQRVKPAAKLIAGAREQRNHFSLRTLGLLIGAQRPDETHEVEAGERGELLVPVNLIRDFGDIGDVHQGFTDAASFRRGAKSVMLLADVFRDLDGVVADRAKRGREIFCSVVGHHVHCSQARHWGRFAG